MYRTLFPCSKTANARDIVFLFSIWFRVSLNSRKQVTSFERMHNWEWSLCGILGGSYLSIDESFVKSPYVVNHLKGWFDRYDAITGQFCRWLAASEIERIKLIRRQESNQIWVQHRFRVVLLLQRLVGERLSKSVGRNQNLININE